MIVGFRMKNFKRAILDKTVILGTMLSEVTTPNIVRIFDVCSFQFMIIDCEHGYFDLSQVASLVAVGRGVQLPILVRIPSIEREHINKVLDLGANGIVIPMVNTEEDALQAVQLAKYPPWGKRGISTRRPHSNYHIDDLPSFLNEANDEIVLFAQIETLEGVNNADRIAGVKGIDALIIGPSDLACDLGVPGDFNNPILSDSIERVIQSANQNNIPSGIIASNTTFLRKWKTAGMTVFSCDSEVGMIMKSAKAIHEGFFLE